MRGLDWKECSFNVFLRISSIYSIYVNSGTCGPVATPEAIVVKRKDIFPEALDDPCDDPLGAQPSWWEPPSKRRCEQRMSAVSVQFAALEMV